MSELYAFGNCETHPWQPVRGACAGCGEALCVLCSPGSERCAACASQHVVLVSPPWEAEGPQFARWWATVVQSLLRPGVLFGRLTDGDVGIAWTFGALCCLLPRLLYGVLDPRGGPFVSIVRAFLSAGVQAASSTFFLGSTHYLWVLLVRRTAANWRVSARASAYAQPIMMVVGVLSSALMLALPALRTSELLRDAALLGSALWFSVPLYHLGHARLRLPRSKAVLTAAATTMGSALLLRLLVR